MEENVQVAWLAAPESGITVAGGAEASAVVDAGGDVDLDTGIFIAASFTPAIRARVGNDLSGAAAFRAFCLLDKDTGLAGDSPLASAG